MNNWCNQNCGRGSIEYWNIFDNSIIFNSFYFRSNQTTKCHDQRYRHIFHTKRKFSLTKNMGVFININHKPLSVIQQLNCLTNCNEARRKNRWKQLRNIRFECYNLAIWILWGHSYCLNLGIRSQKRFSFI